MTAAYVNPREAHAGVSPLSGAPVEGQDSWYHLTMKLPSAAYAPTTGRWNWLIEWHDDQQTAPTSAGPYSIAVGIYTDYPVVNAGVGRNPHLDLRLAGGSSASPTYQNVEIPRRLIYDHWYDLSFHFIWSSNAKVGLAEWFLDGARVLSEHFPTLYRNPDGSHSYNSFGIYNYHLPSPWSSTVDFNEVAIGPTRASVGG